MRYAAPIVRPTRRRVTARRGAALIYATVGFTTLVGILALCVDGSRARTARSELQAASDAAARYAAIAMRSTAGGESAALANAAAVIAQNKVDGGSIAFNPATDVTLGKWNAGNRTFTVATLAGGANAVRVQTRLTLGANGRPYTLLGMLGRDVQIGCESIAMMNGKDETSYVNAKGNPWLAGMPQGTLSTNHRPDNATVHDFAGKKENDASSPGMIDLTKHNLAKAGTTMMFNGVTGMAGNGGGDSSTYKPDGNLGLIVNLGTANGIGNANWPNPMNGIANVRAPINGMIAVFLSDDAPNATSAPSALDFSTAASRDYTSIAPQLKQPFFVGDGRRSSGEAQQIIVPPGATRLFIGNMDAWQWNDNVGGYDVTVNATYSVSTVR